ncbi:MAG: VOC family protein [Planctomycetales bacterium]|nr:VOC family protein [Planctomycetales bacterium]
MRINRVLETSLYVRDLDEAKHFYITVLGAEVGSEEHGRHVFFQVGRQMLLLFVADVSRDPVGAIPPHGCDGTGHVAFAMAHDEISSWSEQLAAHGVEVVQRLDWPNGAVSLYFRDPSDNLLELVTPCLWFADECPRPSPHHPGNPD